MSQQEVDRLSVMERLKNKQLTQVAASRLLGLSIRWVRALQAQYERFGARGLISRHQSKQQPP